MYSDSRSLSFGLQTLNTERTAQGQAYLSLCWASRSPSRPFPDGRGMAPRRSHPPAASRPNLRYRGWRAARGRAGGRDLRTHLAVGTQGADYSRRPSANPANADRHHWRGRPNRQLEPEAGQHHGEPQVRTPCVAPDRAPDLEIRDPAIACRHRPVPAAHAIGADARRRLPLSPVRVSAAPGRSPLVKSSSPASPAARYRAYN